MIKIRKMERSELDLIGEIDRSEEVSQYYVYQGGSLHLKDVHWSVPRWTRDGQGDHSVPGNIATWHPWLEEGGTMFGAFHGEALAAFAIYRPHLPRRHEVLRAAGSFTPRNGLEVTFQNCGIAT